MDFEKLAPQISAILLGNVWLPVKDFTLHRPDYPGERSWFTCTEQLFHEGGRQSALPSGTSTVAAYVEQIIAVRLKDKMPGH
jgi:hypothetical protein